MALTESRSLYEVLVRFDRTGALQGAHAQYLDIVSRDGEPVWEQPGTAIPLALVADGDKPTLTAVLGEAFVAAIAAKEAADAQVATLAARVAELEAAAQGGAFEANPGAIIP